MSKKVLTEEDVRRVGPGSPCYVEPGTIVTPLAQEIAHERQNQILVAVDSSELAERKAYNRRLALGADHAGWRLKEELKVYLERNGYSVHDCGTSSQDPVDYPDYALKVASGVLEGKAFRGIMIDGVGTGSCIVANKVPGIRAANCYDQLTARNSRQHNDSNLLTLGGQILSFELASQIVMTWLTTSFAGGRHEIRVSRIADVEQQFCRSCVTVVPGDVSCAL
ncbi:MAG: ribose 5-phosphate isomerase B [Acidobacteriota bacterium]